MAIGGATTNKASELRADIRSLSPETEDLDMKFEGEGSPVLLIAKLTIGALATGFAIVVLSVWAFQGVAGV